jgi:hypothetical protein
MKIYYLLVYTTTLLIVVAILDMASAAINHNLKTDFVLSINVVASCRMLLICFGFVPICSVFFLMGNCVVFC